MGAIRAFEMRQFGMLGFGRIYEHFLAEDDFQDDEVALLHTTDASYQALTEPLVHIRYFLFALERDGVLTQRIATSIVANLKSLWYGHRTLERATAMIRELGGDEAAATALSYLKNFSEFRIKTLDLVSFLSEGVWRNQKHSVTPTRMPYSQVGGAAVQ
jgi:hypothetical protein